MKLLRTTALFLLMYGAAAAQANAQPLAPVSGGEMAALLKCFFECKEGPVVQGVSTFQEITTHMIANQSPEPRLADVYYFNGREACMAHSAIELSSVDLDELNVCHSLLLAGVVPPPAGLIEILVTDPATSTPAEGVYAWGKNVIGKFRYDNPEPFEGRVTGIGKYECRLVPYEVQAHDAITAKCTGPVEVNPILVEETDDSCSDCNADLNGNATVDAADFAIFNGCMGQPPIGACSQADLNCDGVVSPADLPIFQCQFAAGFPDPACCP